ncbi:type I secretion system permease/ATPase [Pseudochelatococcus contaminans]|uniref:ATP-binding cassette subfamily C protein n=1 Tax=Pseudochelatococcus contaminans TaxID=1538103 RepID=A0A7W5Z5U8_9HYPH|nr:ATP-binding cassette subfamily C protein [Pseudochelatococcus contaminans]
MSTIDNVIQIARSGLFRLFLISAVVNVLLLVQPLYMLQIYDRVLSSASYDTLLYISILAGGAVLLLGILDALRGIISGRISARVGIAGSEQALRASLKSSYAPLGDIQPLRDLAMIRGFIGGKPILGFMDMPFAPLFIGILYFIHPNLFWLTIIGAVALLIVALANQWMSERALGRAGDDSISAGLMAQGFARSADSITVMGMVRNVTLAWGEREGKAMAQQGAANDLSSIFAGISRVLRMGLQIAVLGYGGYLVLEQEMTAGMIFAASLISGRGLQPIDQVIGGWKAFADFRKAWKRLSEALGDDSVDREPTALPAPAGRIEVEKLVVTTPGSRQGDPILKGVSAVIPAGTCVVLIGPSGAGKSTLARAIVGAVKPWSGIVRIDGADITQWDQDVLGRYIGYLAQDADMLPGTVSQNIARFNPNVDDEAIVRAAQTAGAHDVILGLPNGYNTWIGPEGVRLSGGQRQRVGLARAFFGSPKLLVLDEPNANLDADGEQALDRALQAARARGTTVIIVTQRKLVADRADRVMVIREGHIEDYGTRQELMERQAARARAAQGASGQGEPGQPAPAPAQASASRPDGGASGIRISQVIG